MTRTYLFVDSDTGLWSVDESTGDATNLLSFAATFMTGVVVASNEAFFTNHAPGTGAMTQLWVSTGTAAGTSMVTALPDNTPGGQPDTAGISGLTTLGNGEVVFSYFDGVHWSVYLSNGTAPGTVPISNYDTIDGQPLLTPGSTAELNGSFVFENSVTGLWSVNETTGAATHLETFTNADTASMAVANGKVYFNEHTSGTATKSTTQLWTTDGTAGDATLVKSFPDASGGGGSYSILGGLTALADGKVVFTYDDGTDNSANSQIYLSDGTATGTVAITGYTPPTGGTQFGFTSVAELPGVFLFQDIDTGLWSVNEATGAATNILAYQFSVAAGIANIVTANGKVFFTLSPTGNDGNTQLWVTDGSPSGTSMVTTLPDNSPSDQLSDAGTELLTPLSNGDVTFTYFDGASTTTVYLSDGTAGGTKPISNFTGTRPFVFPTEIGELNVACFAEATQIATDRGLRAVETLALGDRIVTRRGLLPLIWLGHRRIVCDRHPTPREVWPIRVAADAFGPDIPMRDLFLSPDHAVFLDGVLIPIRHLVNGITIIQQPRQYVTYWHVELPVHEVIYAEGLATESYLDTGNRANFHGDGKTISLLPNFTTRLDADAAMLWETHGAAPLVMAGSKLAMARRGIAEQASRRSSPPGDRAGGTLRKVV